jgi:DNA replication and repair protein RecF
MTTIECSPGVNLFLGDNGEGKTNLLEGISYLCLSKSFYAVSDTAVLKIEQPGFTVSGSILSEIGVEYGIKVEFDKQQNQKSLSVNRVKIDKASSLIGQFPVVILSPEQSAITFGSPSDRRKFVDFVVSQSSRVYLEGLMEYRQILKQRNKILSDMLFFRRDDSAALEPWNESLIRVGAGIMKKRYEFSGAFQEIMVHSYAQLAGNSERPEIAYAPSFTTEGSDLDSITAGFTQALQDRSPDERKTGYSLVGPHRDEFVFKINGLDVRGYASQGQHKTLLVALKMAEFVYLKERCNETPMLLLDDVFSELDTQRSQRLIEMAADCGQIFITATDERTINWAPLASAAPKKFFVKQGAVDRVETTAHIH